MRTYMSVFSNQEMANETAGQLKEVGVDPNQITMVTAEDRPEQQQDWPDAVAQWQEKGYPVLLAQVMEYLEPPVKDILEQQDLIHMQVLTRLVGDDEWMDDMRYVPTPHTKDLYVKRFTEYEPLFREIWKQEFHPGKEEKEVPEGEHFNVYLPAYRYGYELAVTPRFRTSDWADVAKKARVEWEANDEDTVWEQIEGVVKKAWEVVKKAFEDGEEQGLEQEARRSEYHRHYNQTYAPSGVPYSRFDEAYRFGALLAEDIRYQDRRWDEIAKPVKERWTRDHPAGGDWHDVQEAIQYAWRINKPEQPEKERA